MLAKLRCREVKVRRKNSHLFEGDEKFTGAVMHSVYGILDGNPIRMALGTENKAVALRRVRKLEKACHEGSCSSLWPELEAELPEKTFEVFAGKIGYLKSSDGRPPENPTWEHLREAYEVEMQRKIERKTRGETKQTMTLSTRHRYQQTIRHFEAFLGSPGTLLSAINQGMIEIYKGSRFKAIQKLKQGRGGSSIALDVAVLHGMFRFAVEKELMTRKPIELKNETKPGANPKNGAHPYTSDELAKLRDEASREPKTELQQKVHKATGGDLFVFLVMLWTGLRRSDLVRLCWRHVRFDRGVNGEIEIMTQKRNKIAIIPLSAELRDALDQQYFARKAKPEDAVLLNPDPRNGKQFSGSIQFYNYCLSFGRRAGVNRATPHNYRDTFACDMLTRGIGIYEVAMMLADEVQTVKAHYAKFIEPMRDSIQDKMTHGIGIEKRGELAKQRGEKVTVFPR